jgi:murein DD-endopeptidase MepM/ murein hydrolase activator NlpD
MYFLFGNTNLKKKYKVKSTDTIETIATKNKLGVDDFLVANPDIPGENALLAVGQEVTVDPINPLAGVVIESFETEYQTMRYETKTQFDKTLNADQTYVKQQGSNGLAKVTFATKEVNGKVQKSAQVSSEVIRPVVDRIIVYGAKNVIYYGNTTYWAWPTVKPFKISSYYGYRVHPITGVSHLHSGVDITGTSSKNVFAVQSGKVIVASTGWNYGAGINIKIDHGNGYISQYMHLAKLNVREGETVDKGQVIGLIGCTGSCTGTHLHFTMYKDGSLMDPLKLYR